MAGKQAVFTAETFRFFRELARNNHKEWMDANRERYQQHLVGPMRALLVALAPTALKLNPEFETGGRTGGNFSRINRDIRFAKDKSPYRTQMYLVFFDRNAVDGEDSALAKVGDGQLYAGIAADAVTTGFRIYGNKRTWLGQKTIPRAMENTKWVARQARRLRGKYDSYWYSSEKGDWKKHNGWPVKPEDWKRLKGWIVRRKMGTSAATRASFVPDVAKVFRELFSLYQFTCSVKWQPGSLLASSAKRIDLRRVRA